MIHNEWIISHPYKMAFIMSVVYLCLAILICWKIEDWSAFMAWSLIIFTWNFLFAVLSDIGERK